MEKIALPVQQTIDFLPDGVLVVDEWGTIVMVNIQAEKIFGYKSRELVGQHLNVLIPARYHHAHEGHLTNYQAHPTIRNMGEGQFLYGLRHDNTEFDVSIALSPVQIGERKLVVATVRDITEKIKLQQALELRNEQLEAINVELERFGFTISHDLKSPLANLQGIIHLITRELPKEKQEDLSEHIHHLNKTLHAMSDLISGVAAYSKATLADLSGVEIDMNELMKEVRFLTLLPPHITLEIQGLLPVTWGNKTKLLQVFLNLISNAVKYNHQEHGQVRVSGAITGDFVYFCIEDNGPGIPPRLREKVFEIFEKGASKRSDSQGIGLAIVAKVLHELKGRIAIDESELGGARFKIELPIMKAIPKPVLAETAVVKSCPY